MLDSTNETECIAYTRSNDHIVNWYISIGSRVNPQGGDGLEGSKKVSERKEIGSIHMNVVLSPWRVLHCLILMYATRESRRQMRLKL